MTPRPAVRSADGRGRQHRLRDRPDRWVPAGQTVWPIYPPGREPAATGTVPFPEARFEGGVFRTVQLGAAHLRGLPRRREPYALAALPYLQRGGGHRLVDALRGGRLPAGPAAPETLRSGGSRACHRWRRGHHRRDRISQAQRGAAAARSRPGDAPTARGAALAGLAPLGIEDLGEERQQLLLLGRSQAVEEGGGLRQVRFERRAQSLAFRCERQQAEAPVGRVRAALNDAAVLQRIGERVDIGRIVVEPPG